MSNIRTQSILIAFFWVGVAVMLFCPPCNFFWRALRWFAIGVF